MTTKRELIRGFYAKFRKSFPDLAAKCLKIRDKEGRIRQLELKAGQLYADEKAEDQLRRIGKVRLVVLKARQLGLSTSIGGRLYSKTIFNIGYWAFILTHEARTTRKLFEMTKRYHDNFPALVRPATGSDSAQLLTFPAQEAGYELGTSGNKESGRGLTFQLFHGSEVAFWPNKEEVLAGVMQALADVRGSEAWLESTANGIGDVFYEYVQKAKLPLDHPDRIAEGNDWELVFIPWYWEEQYKAEPPLSFKRTDEEEALAALVANHPDGPEWKFKLSDSQLYWRRKKISDLKSLDKFKQEYPSYVEEAFLFSGRPVFDPNHTEAALVDCIKPMVEYDLSGKGKLIARKGGPFKVWSMPDPTKAYAIGGDVAEGLEHGDYSCLDVLNRFGKQMAQLHGHIEPTELAKWANAIGRFYNSAYLGIERNNHGLTVIRYLQDTYNYPNQHIETKLDGMHDRSQKKYGWLTTSASKPWIIDQLAEAFANGETGIRCRETIDECRRYVKDERGRTNADTGCFDDRVMSYAIAKEMVRVMPQEYRMTGQIQKVVDKRVGV